MPQLLWDQAGARQFETGVDRAVLYIPNSTTGAYDTGVAWNGVVSVTEAPSGAEASPQYADNMKYLNLTSAEELGATLEAFTWPTEFEQFDGSVSPKPGLTLGQQARRPFGLSYRTRVGNDLLGDTFGSKIHLMYGVMAAPTEKAYSTVNESPEAATFSWEMTTTAVEVPGFRPTALITLNSTKMPKADFDKITAILWGAGATTARLPLPAEIFTLAGYTATV